MKRRSLVRIIGLQILVLLLSLLVCGLAQGQKRRRSSTPECKEGIRSDWRYPELAAKEYPETIDLGGGFKASRNCNTVDVNITGAYSDTLTGGHGRGLSFQLAAAVFVRVSAAPTKDAEEAMKKYYLDSKDVRQGDGELMTEYSFRLSNGRTAHIFVYFNDFYGLLGIVKTSPANGKHSV
jgi:hypothetical protein